MKKKSEIVRYSPVRFAPRIKLTNVLLLLRRAKNNVGGKADTGFLVNGEPASIDDAIAAVRRLIKSGREWLYTEPLSQESAPPFTKSN